MTRTRIDPKTRAVARLVAPQPGGLIAPQCGGCPERIKFTAKKKQGKVVCNVYKRGKWDRVEHWHIECYERAGEPHGPVGEVEQLRNHLRGRPRS